MALTYGEIQRLKYETGYNAANVGAEIYVLNGYAAVFDAAIAPYLIDLGSMSTTAVSAQSAPTVTTITLAANPPVTGATVGASYGNVFTQGAKIVVDVGPAQEQNVVILALAGLSAAVTLQNAHGAYGSYPVVLQGGEFLVRDILTRLDVINAQLKGFAPVVAGVAQADEAKLYASMSGGRRGAQRGVTDDLINQRDWARKDLAALLGIQNLWELRGKRGDGGAGATYGAF